MTHRLFTHRLCAVSMTSDAARHPSPLWPRHPAHSEEQGINQEEAADRCGLHRTYYSGIERGIRNVSLVNIEKVGKGLRTSLPKLFERV